jgi:hypothetical protein
MVTLGLTSGPYENAYRSGMMAAWAGDRVTTSEQRGHLREVYEAEAGTQGSSRTL